MIFDYDKEEVFTKQLDVVDIGNTSLRCVTADLVEFYIIIKTVMGKTSILKFGPIMPDLDMLMDSFGMTYKKLDYKEASICKDINLFINDMKKKITDIEEITDYEAFQAIPDIVTVFNNL